MFKFGFSSDDLESEANDNLIKDDLEWLESIEIFPEEVEDVTDQNISKVNLISYKDFIIKYVSDKGVFDTINKSSQKFSNSLIQAEQSHSDLITAVYEGGLKIWECTFDLLHFICKEDIDLNDKKVLDLGCGAGIIGLFLCLQGARTVFQDYNIEVIKSVTIPNVSLNNIDFKKCAFYCGDWESFLELRSKTMCENEKFDYIFTSETIYNVQNYRKLLNIFGKLLKKNGIIYMAAKYHYFGVGGGIGQFQDALNKEDIFNCSTCWTCSEGVKRAIIKITLK